MGAGGQFATRASAAVHASAMSPVPATALTTLLAAGSKRLLLLRADESFCLPARFFPQLTDLLFLLLGRE